MEENKQITQIPAAPTKYKTLKAISERKQQLLTGIRADHAQMDTLWKDLTAKHEQPTRGLRMADMLNTGAGIFDGAMLGLKLYRKYYGFLSKFKKKD